MVAAALPIDPLLPEVANALRAGTRLVIEAPPGAGKTTRVPPALLEVVAGEVLVLEPRRLAARLAARRVAEERGEEVGETVGWQVRFEDVGGPATRLRFVTEGILLRRLLTDPTLAGVGAVVLDEFHERHIQGDLALALTRRLQRGARPDLRIVVMSATLEAAPVIRFLDGCPALRAEGRRFPVDIEHLAAPDDRPLHDQVAGAVRRLARPGLAGDVLVFLPGAAEIQRAREACARAALGVELAMLHGDMAPAEQDRVVRPGDRPRAILSTNVAESSVTLPGVVAVIDSGLARVASHSPWNGLPMLRVAKISQASAAQRAGRAGRLRPGSCLRLYTRHDHDTRPAHEAPEIRRADLAETALALHAAGVSDLDGFDWFEAPDAAAVAAATALLARLGLVREGALTDRGRRALAFPLHPRLARMMLEAEERGAVDDAAIAVAQIGERDLLPPPSQRAGVSGRSDIVEMVERFREAPRRGPAEAVDRARRHIARLARGRRRDDAGGDGLLMAVLAGFPDRVARRRRPGSSELLLAGGGSAEQAPASVVRDADLLVAVDVEERRTGQSRKTLVRAASAIEPEWLIDLQPEALREERRAVWNPVAERVEIVARLRYDELVLDETRAPPAAGDAAEAERVLAEAAAAVPLDQLVDATALARWQGRVGFVARTFPEAEVVAPDAAAALRALCAGRASFAELRRAPLLESLRAALTPAQARLVAEMAPERVALARGHKARVEYPPDQPPWVASRLQDFFGMTRGPSVAGGRVPLVLHLLAPNQRAVQVTTDLDGFWSRHYPTVRKELMRRYPRHAWPEDPRR
jgi:ATP-dependent RNA helicase HrpB